MSKKQTWDPNWQTLYADMTATLAEAAALIRSGQRVFVGTGCAHPQNLVRAMAARASALTDTEIIHFLALGDAPYAVREMTENFRVNSLFISSNVRGIIQEGMGDYTPIFLSDIPRLFGSGQLPLDVALIQVSPPDANGMCSLGISVDIVKSAAANAALVIAEVNPRMPRTHGNSFINVYDIDVLIPVDSELIEIPIPVPSESVRKIGQYIASLVSDGATLELGIGEIPQSVLEFLHDKRDLGIHTEMLTDAIIPLIEKGVITGTRKTLDRGRLVASFCVGTRKLYDYIDDNPMFAFHPTEYVNDSFIIGQQHKQVAINVALEIDLTGQVCADSLGNQFYSGIGGQVDFNRGAARSHGGKAIIALPSTAKDGTVSRISCCLQPGAGVVTTRGDVHYVVTEYGIAYLHGKSVQERAIALISIAHPKFRAELLQQAIESRYVRPEMIGMGDKLVVGPPEFKTTFALADGTQVNIRPIHPTDVAATKELFYALSQETIYYRFMSSVHVIPHKQIQDFVFINHRQNVAIVATMPTPQGDEIIAIGRYYLDDKTNRAEVAFVVRDDWQNKGIGSFLLRHLSTIARRNGIGGFTAEVLRDNRAMQHVFQNCDSDVTSTPNEDVISFRIEFA